jgi:hypothetical protein
MRGFMRFLSLFISFFHRSSSPNGAFWKFEHMMWMISRGYLHIRHLSQAQQKQEPAEGDMLYRVGAEYAAGNTYSLTHIHTPESQYMLCK